ncbi:MAG TPA: phosphate ABC transporter permease subunit PstC [Candidatus Kapabacteria bacterium]
MSNNKVILNPKEREPLRYGKKRNILETVIESLIKGLSFVSIAAIVLIFIFVFREASPIFFGSTEGHGVHSEQSTSATQESESGESSVGGSSSMEQEVYDPLADEKPAAKKSDGNTSFQDKGKIEQEVYDPLADEAPAAKKTETPAKGEGNTSFQDKGKVDQEIYDPLADESAPKPEAPKTEVAPEPVSVDPAELAAAKAESDRAALEEVKNAEMRKDATSLGTMFTGSIWQPVSDVPKYGLIPLFFGSLKTTLIALLFAAPIAIMAALYTSMFAPRRLREVIKPVIELLAGFPSVVIGFFALIVMATFFQDILGTTYRLNSFIGGIAMGLAVIPIVYTISEDALTAVPQPLRDASTALGATRWQTAARVVLPAAIPGVFASLILGFGRAFGETMIALMATGNAAMSTADPFEPVRTFAATIGAEMAEVVFGDEHYNVLFLLGAMLFVFTFTLNSIVEFYIRKRLIKRIQGK